MFLYRNGCNECDFAFPMMLGYLYAIDDQGERHPCRHPGENMAVCIHTGLSYKETEVAGRVGSMKHCVCMECLSQFNLDPDRDPVVFPQCSSSAVELTVNLIDKQCPSCRKGKIERSSPFRLKPDPDSESLHVPEIVKDMFEYLNSRDERDTHTPTGKRGRPRKYGDKYTPERVAQLPEKKTRIFLYGKNQRL